jgi:hypothetical protein
MTLDELAAKATARPWEQGSVVKGMIGHAAHDEFESWYLVTRLAKRPPRLVADAALIVLAVNNIEALAAALRALMEVAEHARLQEEYTVGPLIHETKGLRSDTAISLSLADCIDQARAALAALEPPA